MTRFLEFVLALLLVAVLFVVVGLLLPAERSLSHRAESNRPQQIVFDVLNSFSRFKDWNPLRQNDPQVRYTTSGPVSGEGARLEYSSPNRRGVGSGAWEIVESEPRQRVVYRLENDARGREKTMTFELRPVGRNARNVELTQTYNVKYGYDLLGRYAGLYLNRTVGNDMKRGLGNLSNLLSTIPRFDYSTLERPVQIAEIASKNVLLVPTNAPRTTEGITLAINNNMQWIRQVMEKNRLEADGPLRLVTTEYGAENYAFDLVQPVRERQGTGSAAPAAGQRAESDEDDAADAADGDVPRLVRLPENWAGAEGDGAPLPQLEIDLEGPVQYTQSYGGRAAYTVAIGHPAGLPAVRDQIRAWLLVHGEETQDRPFDEYLRGPQDSFAADAEFVVYWPIKTADRPDWVAPTPVGGEQADENGENGEEAAGGSR
ncbi:SRPBCC family protein [Coralloluteibacterium thermophilus]|uniref:SRPBCC family protein n=1 Tax=Coralloluteibacterium thermophilum TaxID=2707049 RepID=A0ABV9NLH5_9GAMM